MRRNTVFPVLGLSILASLVSLVAIVSIPMVVSLDSGRIGPSPYHQEIEDLYEKTSKGLPPSAPEWAQLDEAITENNMWFEQRLQTPQSGIGPLGVLELKSSKLAPFLAVIWAGPFLIATRRGVKPTALLMLAFPLVLYSLNLYSVLAAIVAAVSIVVVYFVRLRLSAKA